MITKILRGGETLCIEDAHGSVVDDFGYSWVSVKGSQKAWHFRVPPDMKHSKKEYEEELARAESKNQMSQWHIETQDMLQKAWPNGHREFSLDGTRRADFKAHHRVFEAQYSDMSDYEPYERTKYWSEQGYDVTWILAPHILDEPRYEPRRIWHGESFQTANFPTKNLNKWLRPLEFPRTTVIAILPLFEWGDDIEIRKGAQYEEGETGEPCLYRFYDAKYNSQYKNWTVYGGCTWTWYEALVVAKTGRRMY